MESKGNFLSGKNYFFPSANFNSTSYIFVAVNIVTMKYILF